MDNNIISYYKLFPGEFVQSSVLDPDLDPYMVRTFLGFRIRNYFVRIRIRLQILPPTSKKINNNLDFCFLMTFYL